MTLADTPLVSIGIPTYKRANGLKRTLNLITAQNYPNFEVIVSDNHSESSEVSEVLDHFKKDSRIKVFVQDRNIGPAANFHFVQERAKANYFIWAADDDEWQGEDFLSNLMRFAPENVLTFPQAVIKKEDGSTEEMLSIYDQCAKPYDYSRTFIRRGWGYPFYGVYNLDLMHKHQIKFEFDADLLYYNEGTFLHKVFLTDKARYVPASSIMFSTASSKPVLERKVQSYISYAVRTLQVYEHANIPVQIKLELIRLSMACNVDYSDGLLSQLNPAEINEGESASLKNQVARRLKLSARMLLKGY
jgi:glycosyltransferase involved in cell wall biosynthesis